MLIASASEKWADADTWRRAARQAYQTFCAKASREQDTATLDVREVVDIQAHVN